MKAKVVPVIIAVGIALAATMILFHSRQGPTSTTEVQAVSQNVSSETAVQPEQPATRRIQSLPVHEPLAQTQPLSGPMELSLAVTNKLERLELIRQSFRTLAAGDRAAAMRAAKQIVDETERETALLTLVTEWTRGELSLPPERARAIAAFGLEAGLGMELAKQPELATLWANELTDAKGSIELLRQVAFTMVSSDPTAAFALMDQVPVGERPKFFETVLAEWASKDTQAALDWSEQFTDPADRDAALNTIRGVAPVGIGAALAMKDGLPVVGGLIPGAAAELSGQLHPGDRILALAQGDNAFLDAHNLSLQDVVKIVRGDPGTMLQLQVLAADAPEGATPRTVSIVREQIKFKR